MADPRLSRVSLILEQYRGLFEAVGLAAVLVALGINACQLSVSRTLRHTQLVGTASELVRSEQRFRRTDSGEQRTTDSAHGRTASAARYLLEQAIVSGLPLMGFDASHANLAAARFAGADFRGARLHRTKLIGAKLANARFDPYPSPTAHHVQRRELVSDLSDADLSGADLSGADLSHADLSRAVLTDSNLTGANMFGATITGVNLSGANLTDVRSLTQRQLDSACGTTPSLPPEFVLGACSKEERQLVPVPAGATTAACAPPAFVQSYTSGPDNMWWREGRASAYETASPFSFVLRRGCHYSFMGECDRDCSDLDLVLYDDTGDVVASDFLTDDFPVVEYTPSNDAEFTLEVRMVTCLVEPCLWGISVSQESVRE